MELWKQIMIAAFTVILASLLGWASHIQTQLEEVDTNLVSKDVVEYRSQVYKERLDSLVKRVVRLENEVYLLNKKGVSE